MTYADESVGLPVCEDLQDIGVFLHHAPRGERDLFATFFGFHQRRTSTGCSFGICS